MSYWKKLAWRLYILFSLFKLLQKKSRDVGSFAPRQVHEYGDIQQYVIQPENLPPTERATHYHPIRVHLQLAQWKNLSWTRLHSKEWGWKEKNGAMEPVKTDI